MNPDDLPEAFRPKFAGTVERFEGRQFIADRNGREMNPEAKGYAHGYNAALEATNAAGLLRALKLAESFVNYGPRVRQYVLRVIEAELAKAESSEAAKPNEVRQGQTVGQ